MIARHNQLPWPVWPYQLFLTILFFGPPAAALFIATGLPIMTDLGSNGSVYAVLGCNHRALGWMVCCTTPTAGCAHATLVSLALESPLAHRGAPFQFVVV